MNNPSAQYYPEHDRTSCSDAEIVNAEAGGSHGCARCTALLLDQRDKFRKALEEIKSSEDPNYMRLIASDALEGVQS